ncbi:MAG TPA: hypothetical protein VNS88_05680 [Nitrospiraceae bacterium]|nr:hypothetical protein [Nitrospiraceae bacterium]
MRWLIALLLLLVPFVCGCGSATQDVAAAKQFVKGFYSNPAIDFKVDKVEGQEYAMESGNGVKLNSATETTKGTGPNGVKLVATSCRQEVNKC